MSRNATLLLTAIVIGLVGGVTAFIFLTGASGTVRAVVAARDLPPHTLVGGADVRVADVPKRMVEKLGAFRSPSEVIGKVVWMGVPAEGLISPAMIRDDFGEAYSAMSPPGNLVFSLPLKGTGGFAGNLPSGVDCDIYLALNGSVKLVGPGVKLLDVFIPGSTVEEGGVREGLVDQVFVGVVSAPPSVASSLLSAVSSLGTASGDPGSGLYVVLRAGGAPAAEGGKPVLPGPSEGGVD